MPRAYSDQLEAMRAYARTPAGKAAKKRSHANYTQRRREQNANKRKNNPAPLERAILNWRT